MIKIEIKIRKSLVLTMINLTVTITPNNVKSNPGPKKGWESNFNGFDFTRWAH